MLFTINNPTLKEGDIEVDEINADSDVDICEEKDTFSPINYNRLSNSINKQNSIKNGAMKIPNSLQVNNTDHSKLSNIYLLWDRIIGLSKSNLNLWMAAVISLETMELTSENKNSYRKILKEISCNLNKIKYQSVLNRILNLLQSKGDENIIENMRVFIEPVHQWKNMQDSYDYYKNISLIHRECTQQLLREWIANLERHLHFSSITKERKPFTRFRENHKSQIKSETRSMTRPWPVNKTLPK